MTKEIITEVIESYLTEGNENDKLLIKYNGFQGHGLNGVSSKSIWLMNKDYPVTVSHIKQNSGDEDKTIQISYSLKEAYLIARYQDYKKNRFSRAEVFEKRGSEYSVIIPYSNITSLEIRHSE